MKAKDLRIGNNVYDYIDNVITITEIYTNNIQDTSYCISSKDRGDFEIEEIKPIPLTEQWLIDFGGRVISENKDSGLKIIQLWMNYFLLESILKDGVMYHSLEGNIIRIPYVNQLQNIAHSLTGIELIRKQ